MKIRNEPVYLTEIDIEKVEQKYNANYVFESPLFINGNWRDTPSLIFYTETPHPKGSNYFALTLKEDSLPQENLLWISNGISAVENVEITAIRAANGDIIYSHYRHDYRTSDDGSVSIDGGRDYCRASKEGQLLALQVVKGKLLVKDEGKFKWRSIEEPFEPTNFTG